MSRCLRDPCSACAGSFAARLSRPVANADKKDQGGSSGGMNHRGNRIVADGDLTRALRRIRRRLSERRWEIDASGRIRCELLPGVEGHPARMCCPLGMLAAEAPRTRLERALGEPANAEWKAFVEALVDLEVRDHARALRKLQDPPHAGPYAERDLWRFGAGLAVSTMPTDRVSESILAMAPATIRVLSDASDHPRSEAGILLTRSLSTGSNALAEDFREHFRQTVEDAAAASRAAARGRVRESSADVRNEGDGADRAPAEKQPEQARRAGSDGVRRRQRTRLALARRIGNGIGFIARVPAAAISFGVGLWRTLGGNSGRTKRVQLALNPPFSTRPLRLSAGSPTRYATSSAEPPTDDSTA